MSCELMSCEECGVWLHACVNAPILSHDALLVRLPGHVVCEYLYLELINVSVHKGAVHRWSHVLYRYL